MKARHTLSRVTATLPEPLVEAADRLARELHVSRSAVLSDALRAFLGSRQPRHGPPAVGEPSAVPYDAGAPISLGAVGDGALLIELARRLARQAGPAASAPATPAGQPRVPFDRAGLAELCRRHHIRRLSLFGSVLRDDFAPTSDVDVLVEFEPGQTIGFEIITVEEELSALFGGRRVDLVVEKYLNRRLRGRVLSSAQVQYAA